MRISEKLFFLILFSLIFCLVFSYFSCEKNKTPIDSNANIHEIKLSLAEKPGLKIIRLKIELKNVELPVRFRITRDDNIIFNGQMVTNDSVLKDTNLTPATKYNYQAFIFKKGTIAGASDILKTSTMDTTSHYYVWTIDTIGSFGSRLFDVFAISEDDVWAVGEIDTGVYPPFNSMHWNGVEWELKRIPTNSVVGIGYYPINAVFAFNQNNIWMFSNAGSFCHWSGSLWNTEYVSERQGGINKIWGSSSANIYFVGTNGNITHYNGSSWQKLESGTQLRLTDVWGLFDNDIYAVGADISSSDNVVLHYDGSSWNPLLTDQNRKVGVWGTAPDNLYFVGDGVYNYDGENYHLIDWPSGIPPIFSHAVRGTEANNVFVAGEFGLVLHFNGSSWKGYSQLLDFSGTALKSVTVFGNSVFAVGLSNYRGIVFHGRKIE